MGCKLAKEQNHKIWDSLCCPECVNFWQVVEYLP